MSPKKGDVAAIVHHVVEHLTKFRLRTQFGTWVHDGEDLARYALLEIQAAQSADEVVCGGKPSTALCSPAM
jgi:hypothetical protein